MQEFFKEKQFGPFIDGKCVIDEKKLQDHPSLVLQKHWKQLAHSTKSDVMHALASAQRGQKVIQALSAYERATILKNMATHLRENGNFVAEWITLEMGKTIREAKGEVEYAANYFEWFAEEAKRIYGYTAPSTQNDKHIRIQHEPIGIVAVITPWNFPIAMAARKVGPAIAAGCASIVRPSTDTSLSMLAIAKIAKEAGLPDGGFNVVPGDPVMISDLLLEANEVRKLTFTGSTEIGKILYGKCVSTLKKATMELGGHAPVLILEDADVEKAATETINAKLRVSGQTCVCANRIFVHHSILESFTEKLLEKISTLKIGNPLEETTDLTNVLHPSSNKKVPRQIEDAIKKGAACLLRGQNHHEPTILTGITKDMDIFTEETFGPVFPIISFESEEEALALANDTIFGLAAYVFTQDINKAHKICNALNFGIIGLNDGRPTTPQAPFGGVKASGFGREGGRSGIYEYLTEKTISLKF